MGADAGLLNLVDLGQGKSFYRVPDSVSKPVVA